MATLSARLSDFITRVGTEFKSLRVVTGNLASLDTSNKTSLVLALNEVRTALLALPAPGASINDASTTSTTQTWSVAKIVDAISVAITTLTTGAPGALDTLDELAAALGDDANFASTITTALGNRVRVDTAAQGLTSPQRANARTNIDAYGSVELGNPDTDLVALFVAALV